MDLNFVSATKPVQVSPAVRRRQKLVQRIDQQLGYCEGMKTGQHPRAAWPWMDDAGSYFVPVKYGRHVLELKKGMFAVQCKDVPEIEAALTKVRAMALSGDFDDQLGKVSTEIRKRFSGA